MYNDAGVKSVASQDTDGPILMQDMADLSDSETAPQPSAIPDGGTQAWLSVIGGFLISFCTVGYSNSFGVYVDYYDLLGTSTPSNISWIGSVQLCLMLLMGLPAGRLLAAGHFHKTILFGSTLLVFSLFMLSLADPHNYYQLILSQGVGFGIGTGLLLVPAQSVQAHHWSKRRSLAISIVMSGSAVGGLVYPIMLNQLFSRGVGFAWSVRASAFLTLGVLIVANCIMTARPSNVPKPATEGSVSLRAIITDPPFILVALGFFFIMWGLYFPYFYLQLWVNLHGLSGTLAFYTIAILNAASIPGRLTLSLLADQLGLFNVLCSVIVIIGVLVFSMFGVTNTAAVIIFSILYGWFSGSFVALGGATLASLAKSPAEVGLTIGLCYFVGSFASLTGMPIDGALMGTGPVLDWYKAIIFSAVTILAGAGLVTLARMMYATRKGTQRL
ncbi:uncharacterized protein FIBRA_00462 [Fibroporia radiculosa]|uniref:Major facilitator superfamily (MFS) profile domain-containing protein n=1 Tax=Fibroporia radiculosa TaxID=599839 RepID=J4H015_9APHY|nr:uncharacterized protein FIBRA_00462 [Fibroporia radiculosa]CCL98464.1 predicted protein [Fibroporia radiculosa]